MEMKILVALDIPLRSGVRTLQIHYCFSRVFPNRILLRTGMSRSHRLGLRGSGGVVAASPSALLLWFFWGTVGGEATGFGYALQFLEKLFAHFLRKGAEHFCLHRNCHGAALEVFATPGFCQAH